MNRAAIVVAGFLTGIGVLFAAGLLSASMPPRPSIPDSSSDDPQKVAEEFGWVDSGAQRWSPSAMAGTGIPFAIGTQRGAPCILFIGPGTGAPCFGSGWAVEVSFRSVQDQTFVLGSTITEAAFVRFGKSRDALRVPVERVPGRVEGFIAFVLPDGALDRVKPDDIVALDEHGRLLGRQHANDGHGGFGAMDGIYDRRLR
ncbi:MAG TPA: hypothetical protein VI300_18075 [Solirubrobacter sp.]